MTEQSLETALTLFERGYDPVLISERLGLNYGRQFHSVINEARKARRARQPMCEPMDYAKAFAAFSGTVTSSADTESMKR
ncbi:hypothetical protein [Aminobacter aminovorans]|uniref:hypothetical protein n=1 Tax=Aminobacter aminovorans TaxID=83263 RepID=UPI00285CDFA5|nr:hypothetical protein [Aminobacter aminovorans]MDR7219862.1 hypothetical protein [Aminobacter aminovorans]